VVPFYPAALGFTKLSILAFYWRVFGLVDVFRRIIITTGVLIILATFAFTIAFIFQSTPIRQFWTPTPIPGATCINAIALWHVVCIFNIITDFFILLLPLPLLMRLRLPRVQKILALFLLTMGGVSCGAAIFRYYELLKFFTDPNEFYDYTWTTVGKSVSSELEFCVAAIAASIPAIKPLISRNLPGLLSFESESRRHESNDDSEKGNRERRADHRTERVELSLTPSGYAVERENHITSGLSVSVKDSQEHILAALDESADKGIVKTTGVKMTVEQRQSSDTL